MYGRITPPPHSRHSNIHDPANLQLMASIAAALLLPLRHMPRPAPTHQLGLQVAHIALHHTLALAHGRQLLLLL